MIEARLRKQRDSSMSVRGAILQITIRPLMKQFATSLLLLIISCGPKDLTREEAKRILDSDPHFTPVQSLMHRIHVLAGTTATACDNKPWPPPNDAAYPRVVTEVTGITMPAAGETGRRIVEFKWEWMQEKLSPDLARCLFPSPKPATAVFQLYDDGWRVVEVTCPWCSSGAV